MSDEVIDLIIVEPTDPDTDTWDIYSPQVPGFTGGSESLLQLQADIPSMMEFAGVTYGAQTRLHVEHVYSTDDVDFIIRLQNDEHQQERLRTVRVLEKVLADPRQRKDLLNAPRTRTGEVLFICAVSSDQIQDLAAQLHPSGDVAVIIAPVADYMIWSTHLANAADLVEDGHPPEYWGWSPNVTIGELMHSPSVLGRPRNVLIAA